MTRDPSRGELRVFSPVNKKGIQGAGQYTHRKVKLPLRNLLPGTDAANPGGTGP